MTASQPKRSLTFILGTCLLLILSMANAQISQIGLAQHGMSQVHRFADFSVVEGAASHLVRTNRGVVMELYTSELEPGSVYTVWWVVFNNPGGCSPEKEGDPSVPACGEDDIINEAGEMSPNPLARISVLWAGGGVSAEDGRGSFSAFLPVDQPPGELLFGPGLENAHKAEVHLVLRTHGQADLNRLYEQLNTFEMECAECSDVQFAVHLPAQ